MKPQLIVQKELGNPRISPCLCSKTLPTQSSLADFDSKINSAKSKVDAAKANLKIEEKQLTEIEEQLTACEIIVPEGQSGQVVYANIFSRRGKR